MPFKIDNTPYYEAILFPDGTRAFFLVQDGFGMPSKTCYLADKIVEILNSIPKDEMDKILNGTHT